MKTKTPTPPPASPTEKGNHVPEFSTGGPYEWISNPSPPPSPPPSPCHRFIPKGRGLQWTIDKTRSVTIQPGERGDLFVTWRNESNQVNVRLSKEAAAMTALALLHCGKNLMADCEGEPAA